MREQKNTTLSFEMSWKRKLHATFILKYFLDNWHACRHMWVHCWRGSSPHMGNQTTNRLESFHGKVKAYLHPNMTISNCVDELLHFDRRKEIQTTHEVIVSSVKA